MKLKLLLLTLLPSIAFAHIDIEAQFKDIYAQTNNPSYINCAYTITIKNNTSENRKFTIGNKICVDNKGCYEVTHVAKSEPGKTYQESNQIVWQPVFNRPGKKALTCFIWVDGAEIKNKMLTATAYVS